jgi:transcriptional regulator with XRE-family HTH domain
MANRNIQGHFGRRVRALRKAKGLSQEALADAIGRSVDTVSNVERGVLATRLATAQAIAEALGVTLRDVFDFEGTIAQTGDPKTQALLQRLNELASGQNEKTLAAMVKMAEIITERSSSRE